RGRPLREAIGDAELRRDADGEAGPVAVDHLSQDRLRRLRVRGHRGLLVIVSTPASSMRPPGIGAGRPCDTAAVSEWSDLRYFLAVARTGTLAGAARELKVE